MSGHPGFKLIFFFNSANIIAGIVPARMIKDSQRDIFSFFSFLLECFDSIFDCKNRLVRIQ